MSELIERLQRAYRPPDLVEYNALQARVEKLEGALRTIAKNLCKQPECYATDIAIDALEATEQDVIVHGRHVCIECGEYRDECVCTGEER
jgi:hypothetical protein